MVKSAARGEERGAWWVRSGGVAQCDRVQLRVECVGVVNELIKSIMNK